MVEKKVIRPAEDYLTRGAIEKKETDPETRFTHTRECHELNEALNCKMITEKKCTEEESQAYSEILEEQRRRNEGRKWKRKVLKRGPACV